MEVYFNKTSIGFKHIREGKVCQDYSDCYHDDKCTILTTCDGHGGALYVRSDRGARFASQAFCIVLKGYIKNNSSTDFLIHQINRIKFEVLCEWNRLVEQDFAMHPFEEEELAHLTQDKRFELKCDYVLAYGTTMHAICITGNACFCMGIGDGGIFVWVNNNDLMLLWEDDDETVANLTYSMCSENAFDKLNASCFSIEKDKIGGIMLCTDGITNPYASYSNFSKAFAVPIFEKIAIKGGNAICEIKNFVDSIGQKLGLGDDASLALYYKK